MKITLEMTPNLDLRITYDPVAIPVVVAFGMLHTALETLSTNVRLQEVVRREAERKAQDEQQ